MEDARAPERKPREAWVPWFSSLHAQLGFLQRTAPSSAYMLIFLDTEFTDFIDCDLISIGMVSEDGQHEFYAERNDYVSDWQSDFVRVAVVPLLRRHAGCSYGRAELSEQLRSWFSTLPRNVQIACDSAHDRDLLWDAFDQDLPANLSRSVFDLRPLIDTTVFHRAVCRYHDQPERPWHHAMHDAHAHRAGWLAWQDDKRQKRSAIAGAARNR
jgi:hypothetical protein